VFLADGAWNAWERLIQGLPSSFGGLPTTEAVLVNDTYTVQLSTGSVLVGNEPNGDFYPLITFTYDRWLESGGRAGCLGLPTTDPAAEGAGFGQQFERGSMYLDVANGGLLFLRDDQDNGCVTQ
jgi:uncharacterized protein with LGFP repeats